MAIDAVITKVQRKRSTEVPGRHDLVLALADRPAGLGGQPSRGIAGQSILRIVGATWEPQVGMMIWGGAGLVEIVDGAPEAQRPVYRRHGLSRLTEAIDYPRGRFFLGHRGGEGPLTTVEREALRAFDPERAEPEAVIALALRAIDSSDGEEPDLLRIVVAQQDRLIRELRREAGRP